MIVLAALLFDFIASCLTGGWYTCFTIIAMLQLVFKEQEELLDLFNIIMIGMGFLLLCALDVAKYGRAGISLGIILLGFCAFYAARHYVVSSEKALLMIISVFLVCIDVFCIQKGLLGFSVNWAMTVRLFFGTITGLSLAFLGVRGSRS